MMQLYNLKTLRLVGSVFSCAFASKPKRFVLADPKPSKLCLPNQLLCRPFTSEISETHQDFKVNYLINTCGLSPEGAISVSKRVKLESPKKAESVLALFRNHGLSQTQISRIVRSRPQVLSADPEKILLPKLEFFISLGVSRVDLAKILAYNPHLLAISLANRIIPTYDVLRSILSEKNVVALFKRYSQIFLETRFKNVIPNIELLRESGMRPRGISLVLTYCTPVLMVLPEQLGQLVAEIKEMGFNLEKTTSVNALCALCGKNRLVWNRCREAFKRWGWSDVDVLSAFKKNPQCMMVSERKLMQAMDLLVNKMGWSSEMIAKCPVVLGLSLERRLIPRCSVVKVLLLKGLMNDNLNLGSVLKPTDKQFLEMFVKRYLGEVPRLLSVYQGKVDIQDA